MLKTIGDSLHQAISDQENKALPGLSFKDINIQEIVQNALEKVEALNARGSEQVELFEETGGYVRGGDRGGERGGRGRAAPGVAKTAGESQGERSGTEGKLKEPEANYVEGTYLKEPSQSDKASFRQGELPFGKSRAKSPGDTGPEALPRSPRNIVMRTTGRIDADGNTVSSAADAAALLSFLTESPQERIYVLATDKKGKVLQIHDYTKGTRSASSVGVSEVVGPIFDIPNAKQVYFTHNHPGGGARPNASDQDILQRLKELLALKDIDLQGQIVSGDTYVTFTEKGNSEPAKIRRTIRKTTLPKQERAYKKAGTEARMFGVFFSCATTSSLSITSSAFWRTNRFPRAMTGSR